MKRIACLIPRVCLVLLLVWGICAPLTTAQNAPPWQAVVVSAPLQTITVNTPRGSYQAVFQSAARVLPSRAASGFLILSGPIGLPSAGGENVGYADGHVKWTKNGLVARVDLRGQTAEGVPVIVRVTPIPAEECVVYDLVGPGVQASWEAQGQLTVIRR